MSRNMQVRRWATRISAAWQSSRDSILKCGLLLIDAKAKLVHGEFEKMVQTELPFGSSTAQRLMKIARDKRLTNPAHAQLLPPSWYALYRLSLLSDAQFETAIADGTIRPDMERSELPGTATVITSTRSVLQPKTLSIAVSHKTETLHAPYTRG